MDGYSRLVGNCFLRILFSGSGQQDRNPAHEYRPAKSRAGSYYDDSLWAFCCFIHESSSDEELSLCEPLPGDGGFFYVQGQSLKEGKYGKNY